MKRKQSKHKQIKAHLDSGRNISGLGAWALYDVYRLSSVINRLRNKGMKIKTKIDFEGYAIYTIID